jgi:hypothetical protein
VAACRAAGLDDRLQQQIGELAHRAVDLDRTSAGGGSTLMAGCGRGAGGVDLLARGRRVGEGLVGQPARRGR